MKFIKALAPQVFTAILAAVVAGMSAYIAVRGDITILTVNQGFILEEIKQSNKWEEETRREQYKQGVRIALLEREVRR